MKNWTDQPDEVEGWPVLTAFHVRGTKRGVGVEVRMGPNLTPSGDKSFYVSHGNLFGSQTLHCKDGDAAFRVIGEIVDSANTMEDNAPLREAPQGCKVLKNAETK